MLLCSSGLEARSHGWQIAVRMGGAGEQGSREQGAGTRADIRRGVMGGERDETVQMCGRGDTSRSVPIGIHTVWQSQGASAHAAKGVQGCCSSGQVPMIPRSRLQVQGSQFWCPG